MFTSRRVGGKLKVWLRPLALASSEGLKPTEIREGLLLTREYRAYLLFQWHEYQARQNP